MTNDNETKRTAWEMGHIPQHVVMEMWSLKGTETKIIWGINLHADGNENLPYWVEYYPHYSPLEERQECTSEDFHDYEEVVSHIQELMNMSDEEYIDETAVNRNQFFQNIAEIMMYMD